MITREQLDRVCKYEKGTFADIFQHLKETLHECIMSSEDHEGVGEFFEFAHDIALKLREFADIPYGPLPQGSPVISHVWIDGMQENPEREWVGDKRIQPRQAACEYAQVMHIMAGALGIKFHGSVQVNVRCTDNSIHKFVVTWNHRVVYQAEQLP